MTAVATGVAPTSIATDGVSVDYLQQGDNAVYGVAVGDGGITTLATGEAKPLSVAMDGTYTYWTSNLGGAIRKTLSNGTGMPSSVTSASNPTYLITDGTTIYWIDSSGLSSVPTGGGATKLLQSNANDTLLFAGSDVMSSLGYFTWYDFIPPNTVKSRSEFGLTMLGAKSSTIFFADVDIPMSFGWFDLVSGTVLAQGVSPMVGPFTNLMGPPNLETSIVPLDCGAYVAANKGGWYSTDYVLWWVPLRIGSNVALPTAVPITMAADQMSLTTDGTAVYLGTHDPDGGVDSGAIYTVGKP